MVKRVVTAIALAGVLMGCADLANMVPEPGTQSCASYNRHSYDGFRLYLYPSSVTLKVGQTAQLALETTWLDNDLNREAVSCVPDWYSYPQGFGVAFDPETLVITAQQVGTVRLVARVKGAYMAEDSVDITIKP